VANGYSPQETYDVKHLEESLQRDMNQIVVKIRQMAGLVEEAVSRSMKALAEMNRQTAYSVILRDQRIDELEKEIDRLCLEFIVRQQPVAKTLRFAYAVIKINAALERVGDYAESMARQILVLCSLEVQVPFQRFEEIASHAIPMLHAAVEAFVQQDPESARAAMKTEEVVDRLRHQLGVDLVHMPQRNELPIKALSPLLSIMNRLERSADQAKDICQEVLYMCTGEYLKHAGSDMFRVLFVDDDNACASQMAEAIGQSLAHPQFVFWSAGLARNPIDSGAVEFLRTKDLDISGNNSKAIDQVPHLDNFQVIVALSVNARQVFPPPPTKVVCLDWSEVASQACGQPTAGNNKYSIMYEFLLEHVRDIVEAVVKDQNN
jgi:phosphate transport system protein